MSLIRGFIDLFIFVSLINISGIFLTKYFLSSIKTLTLACCFSFFFTLHCSSWLPHITVSLHIHYVICRKFRTPRPLWIAASQVLMTQDLPSWHWSWLLRTIWSQVLWLVIQHPCSQSFIWFLPLLWHAFWLSLWCSSY